MGSRTVNDTIVRQTNVRIHVERNIYRLQCDIMKLIEKIINDMNNAVDKRFPLDYDADRVLYEQTETAVLSAIRMISTELNMDYGELFDKLKSLE